MALLKDNLKTDVEKNPGPASESQRQAEERKRKGERGEEQEGELRK